MTKYNVNGQEEYLLESNLLGAKSMEELEQLEGVAFYLSSTRLEEEGFDFLFPLKIETISTLHKKLFGDIYIFSGKIRNVSLMKQATRFCEPSFIKEQLISLCAEINEETEWKSTKEAAIRLAYFKTELNMIHPFREGNGRTIRLIIRELAQMKGFEWNFDLMKNEEYNQAMIASPSNTSKIEKIIYDSLKPLDF